MKAPRGSGAICLVEDDSLVREFTRSVLVDLGYSVHDFGNDDDALAAIDAGLPVDLLLTDIVLPGRLNGNQLGQAARSRRPDLKVLYVSGYSENAIIHHGRLDPGVELLSKPFRRVDLAMRLQNLLS